MTAILEEIRRLEAAHNRGELSKNELATAKSRLMARIEEADVEPPPANTGAAPSRVVFDVVMFCMIGAAVCVLLGTFIFGDLTLALTLTITLVAALAVRAFRALDD